MYSLRAVKSLNPTPISNSNLEVFKLYEDEDLRFFFSNTSKIALTSVRLDITNSWNVTSIMLYSEQLNKLLLLPSVLLEREGEFFIPNYLKEYFGRFEKKLKKALLRASPNKTEFFHLPKEIEWLRYELDKLDRFYLCLNDFPTGLHHLKRYWFAKETLEKLVSPQSTVLEVGCGMGYFQNLLNRKFKYYCVEIDEKLLPLIKLIDLRDRTNVLNKADLQADAIISLEVIEHTKNPIKFMKDLISYSHDKTKFIVSVP